MTAATFEDLILQAQPAWYDDGCFGGGTVGMTWMWVLESPAGGEVDWTDVEFEVNFYDPDTGAIVFSMELSADEANRLTLYASATSTELLDNDRIMEYPWEAFATKVDDRVCLWGRGVSRFTVFPGDVETVEGSEP